MDCFHTLLIFTNPLSDSGFITSSLRKIISLFLHHAGIHLLQIQKTSKLNHSV